MPVGDGRFSGPAAFSLLGFAVVLAVVALAGLRPWEADTAEPRLSVSPGIGGALGDAVALGHARIGPDRAPRDAGVGLAAATAVTPVAAPATAPGRSGVRLAVAQARLVTAGPPKSPSSPRPESIAPPLAQMPPAAPTAMVPAVEPSPSPPAPIAAGVLPEPDEVCEGDEYEVRTSFDSRLVEGATVVVIQIRRAGDDEAEDEVLAEGELLELLESLTAEGDCVRTVVEPGEAETAPS